MSQEHDASLKAQLSQTARIAPALLSGLAALILLWQPLSVAQSDPEPAAPNPEPAEATPAPEAPGGTSEPTVGVHMADNDGQRRMLLVGDSHTQGAFGWALDYLLRAGVEDSIVATYAVCASGPLSWAKGNIKHHCGRLQRGEDFKPDAESPGTKALGLEGGSHKPPRVLDLLHKHKPDTLVVALGENLKGFRRERVEDMTGEFVRRIECYKRGETNEMKCRELDLEATPVNQEVTCIWVLPHYSRAKGKPAALERLYDAITQKTKGVCTTIDSRAMTCHQGEKDPNFLCDYSNYHLPPKRYRRWAINVMATLIEMLDLPVTSDSFLNDTRENWNL